MTENTTSTHSNKRTNNDHLKSAKHCPIFDGTSSFDWLMYLSESWRPYLQFLDIEEEVVHGTIHGRNPSEFTIDPPSLLQKGVTIWNNGIIDKKEGQTLIFKQILSSFSWAPYYLNNPPMKVPIGRAGPNNLAITAPNKDDIKLFHDNIPFGKTAKLFKSYYPWVKQKGNVLLGDQNDRTIWPFQITKLIDLLADHYVLEACISSESEKARTTVYEENPDDPNAPKIKIEKTEREIVQERLSLAQLAKLDELMDSANAAWRKDTALQAEKRKNMLNAFGKLGQRAHSLVHSNLEKNEYHEAYKKINAHYLSKGISDVSSFESQAKSIKIQLGQELSELLNLLQNAFQRWASVEHLHQQSIQNNKDLSSFQVDVKMAIANSYDKTDAEIIAQGYPVLIPEAKRLDILCDSVSDCDRFKPIIDRFAATSATEKSVSSLVSQLENLEKSKQGQRSLAKEREHSRGSSKSSNAALTASANVASTPAYSGSSVPAAGTQQRTAKLVFPKGSCIHHPDSTTHTTAKCKKRGLSSTPNISLQSLPPAPHVENHKKKQRTDNNVPSTRHCSYCERNHPNVANTHSQQQCFRDPQGPNFRGGNNSNHSSSVPQNHSSNNRGYKFSAAIEQRLNDQAHYIVTENNKALQDLTKTLKRISPDNNYD